MDETLITETTTQAGQKKKKATKYINPSATNEQVKGFAQLATALTTDNYDGAYVTSYRTKGEVVFQTKPTPNLSIGGWSAVDTVYAAPITYDGDGELSVNVGSISNGSLIVNDADGIFNGVLTASAGDSYASTAFGFSYDTNYVTIQGGGGDIPDSIVTALGSKFVPTVSTPADFIDNADNNIQFFDNRLKKILNDTSNYNVDTDYSIMFRWHAQAVTYEFNESNKVNYLSANNTIALGTDNSTLQFICDMVKLTETTGFVQRRREHPNGTRLTGVIDILPFSVNELGNVATQSNITVCSASTAVSNRKTNKWVDFKRSILNPSALIGIQCNETLTTEDDPLNRGYYWHTYEFGGKNGAVTRPDSATIGLWTSTGTNCSVDSCYFVDMYTPKLSFDDDTVTITKRTFARKSSIIFYEKRFRNSSGNYTTGGDFVTFSSGNKASSTLQLTTISGGVTSTVNTWLCDDGRVLLNFYPNKSRSDAYAITYKPGTYSKDTYLQDAFKVWYVDFTTPRFVESSKTLPQVLDDLAI